MNITRLQLGRPEGDGAVRVGRGAGYFSGLRQVNAYGPPSSNALCLDELSHLSQLRPKIPDPILRAACPTVI